MSSFHKQTVHSSYADAPLVYSMSTQNNFLSSAKSFTNNDLKAPAYTNPSVNSSTITFSNLQSSKQIQNSNLQRITGQELHFDSSLRFDRFSQPGKISPRFGNVNTTFPQEKIQQNKPTTQIVPPSHQILANQHNYVFGNNHSSLRNFQDKKNQTMNKNPSFSPLKYSPPVYKYNQPLMSQNTRNQMKQQIHEFNPLSSNTFGYQKVETFVKDHSENKNFTSVGSYDFNKYSGNAQKSQQVNFLPPTYQTSSLNPSFGNLGQIQSVGSTLQSKLLNRELTQLKSDQELKTTVINDEGVQRFPLKFDTSLREESDFGGFCGFRSKRIIFNAAQKTPFC